jgi:hypothetical protein
MWPCECRAVRAADRRRRGSFRLSSASNLLSGRCAWQRSYLQEASASGPAIQSSEVSYVHFERVAAAHRLRRWQDGHVHLAHDRYCPCRCDQCAFPSASPEAAVRVLALGDAFEPEQATNQATVRPTAPSTPRPQARDCSRTQAPTAESSPAPENFFAKTSSTERLPPFWGKPFLDTFLGEGA